MLLVFVLIFSALAITPGVNLFGFLGEEAPLLDEEISLIDEEAPLIDEEIPEIDTFSMVSYYESANTAKMVTWDFFTYNTGSLVTTPITVNYERTMVHDPKNPSSHIQGYARYRGSYIKNNNTYYYDYHIFTHSDVSGQRGLIYIVSDNDRSKTYQFLIHKNPERENYINGAKEGTDKGYWLNHPGGIQLLGDTLVVALQGATTSSFSGNSQIVAIDLSPLKTDNIIPMSSFGGVDGDKNNLKNHIDLPSRILLDLPGIGATSVGVINIPTNINDLYDLNTEKTRYMLVVPGKTNFEYYVSTNECVSLYDAVFTNRDKNNHPTTTSTSGISGTFGFTDYQKYQTIGLYRDLRNCIYLTGFQDDGYIHVYKLAELNKIVSDKYRYTNKKVTISEHRSFRWAGGIEVESDGTINFYATEKNPQGNGLIRIDKINDPDYIKNRLLNFDGTEITEDLEVVPVTEITDLPEIAIVNEPFLLTGRVLPEEATNKEIVWSITDPDNTDAIIEGNEFIAFTEGNVQITATVINGLGDGIDFTLDFFLMVKRPEEDIVDPGADPPGDDDADVPDDDSELQPAG